ncbi:syntaxin protein, partial [Toxoplasma gondii GT1]
GRKDSKASRKRTRERCTKNKRFGRRETLGKQRAREIMKREKRKNLTDDGAAKKSQRCRKTGGKAENCTNESETDESRRREARQPGRPGKNEGKRKQSKTKRDKEL